MERRNYAGVQLIDRNDELCILYEKSNVHEAMATKGNVRMCARVYVCARVCVYRCVCICMYMYICMSVYKYAYTFI